MQPIVIFLNLNKFKYRTVFVGVHDLKWLKQAGARFSTFLFAGAALPCLLAEDFRGVRSSGSARVVARRYVSSEEGGGAEKKGGALAGASIFLSPLLLLRRREKNAFHEGGE